jgi:hypothetical protein
MYYIQMHFIPHEPETTNISLPMDLQSQGNETQIRNPEFENLMQWIGIQKESSIPADIMVILLNHFSLCIHFLVEPCGNHRIDCTLLRC